MNPRFFLLPFSLLYGSVVFFRNKLYDTGIFRSAQFKIPVIGIGNISTGGTGKTPHVEYLLRLLGNKATISTLSRGYGRDTNGFYYVSEGANAQQVGDEPLQLKHKFREAVVAVCENRKAGIEKIMSDNPAISAVVLDDVYQHRAVKPGISILLMQYSGIFKADFLLPAGDLREPFSAKRRADIIIVSKCPLNLLDNERERIIKKIAAGETQRIFFSSLIYKKLQPVFGSVEVLPSPEINVLLVTGIADASLIKTYCRAEMKLVKHVEFADHHAFSESDITNIIEIFSTITAANKIILTTEKDAMRLTQQEALKQLPIYYLPVEVQFHEKDKEQFNKLILDYVGKN